jgi:heme/copper-type cytochrome/quinol oxidase subunit 3
MNGQNVIPLHPSQRTRSAVVEDGTIGMLAFVIVEAMMFAGLVSAFMVTRAGAGGAWPPAGQPRLPLEATAVNTAALLLSGVLVFAAARTWERREARTGPLLLASIALGAVFVFFQGMEWVALIRQGLTLTSSQHGSFFYLIVGMHGAHAVAALVFMGIAWLRLRRGALSNSAFSAARILWYFVVGVWPVLYLSLYL